MRNLWCFLDAVLSFLSVAEARRRGPVRPSGGFGLVFLLGTVMVPGAASGQVPPPLSLQVELAAEDSREFGSSVALSSTGDTALVASGRPVECVQNTGPCHIADVFTYRSGQWLRQAALVVPPAEGSDSFDPSVALSNDGNTALVGLPHKDCDAGGDCGAAYVFIRSGETWSLQGTLRPSDETPRNFFGFSVALSGDGSTALIGTSSDGCGATGQACGAAYVFTRNGSVWSQQSKLTSSVRAHREFFGHDVSLSADGNTALIGAYGDRRAAPECDPYFCGAAYVFVRNGAAWSEEKKLTAPNPRPNSGFGFSVALSGDGGTAAINNFIGMIHIFTRGGGDWAVDEVLEKDSAYFGFSMAFSENGDSLLAGDIGTPCHTLPGGFDCGAAYLFLKRRGVWREVQELNGSIPVGSYGRFGRSVSLSGDGRIALIGAPEEGCYLSSSFQCGSAYIFGASQPLEDIPAVSHLGLALLALLLAASGAGLLARRRRSA